MSLSKTSYIPHGRQAAVPLALALLASLVLAGPLQAEQVSAVQVAARLPTSTVVPVAGRNPVAVRHDIRLAADDVCQNAYLNGDLGFIDDTAWCSDAATDRALAGYRVLLRSARDGRQVASADTAIIIAMR